MKLESYHYSPLKRLWLKLEARSSDKNTENIASITPVLLFMQKDHIESLLDELPKILTPYLKPHLIQSVFNYSVLKLKKYSKDEQLFIQERHKALECIATNIQLYGLVIDLLKDESQDSKDMIEQIVRKKYDKDYQLSKENLRLLTYQEKYL
ncbi:hypothetical protein [Helicobacter marmotae]|uniref:Uncharacterized protein n=1 Tax=Helicobacter marmotae TaxID=152490 RepID=A0A3D8I517_9HELI|nr:hypothetical protein [Helicobacter marmotae]RDU59854.1 hypothetical protein CQA63_05420 [Helicobacter marmotae]